MTEPLPDLGTVRGAVRWAVPVLAQAGCDTPRLDAELLLGHVLGATRTALQVRSDEALVPEAARRFTALVRQRAGRVPLAYLTGVRPFYDLSLRVAPGVLVPRPETELLVDEVLAWCRGQGGRPLRIADVGTGSGAIAVTLAAHLERATVVASDLSAEALAVAARNVASQGLVGRISLVRCDLLSALRGPFDVIVANLPYVPSGRLASLMPEVRDHEPRLALDGGPTGLDVIARLLPQAAERLAWPGLVALEIDETHGEQAECLARGQWPGAEVRRVADLAGLDRLVCVTVSPAGAQPSPQPEMQAS